MKALICLAADYLGEINGKQLGEEEFPDAKEINTFLSRKLCVRMESKKQAEWINIMKEEINIRKVSRNGECDLKLEY